MGQNGINLVKDRFQWPTVAITLEEIYKEIIVKFLAAQNAE